jgi:hypothetical protein
LLEVLIQYRPGDIWLALDAAEMMEREYRQDLSEGLDQLPTSLRTTL